MKTPTIGALSLYIVVALVSFTAFAASLVASPAAVARMPRVAEVNRMFNANKDEFATVKSKLLGEKEMKFSIGRVGDRCLVTPESTHISAATLDLCKQLMQKLGCNNIVRSGDSVWFELGTTDTPILTQQAKIVYNEGDFKDNSFAIKKDAKSGRTLMDLQPKWKAEFSYTNKQ